MKMDKKGQVSLNLNLTMIVVYVVLILVAALMFIFWKDFRFYVIGGLFVFASLIFIVNVGARRQVKKSDISVFLILLVIGVVIVVIPFTGLSQTEFFAGVQQAEFVSSYKESVIPCNQVSDCGNYLLSKGVSSENINLVDFKCENGYCLFKEK